MKASELREIVSLLSPCLGDPEVIQALSYICFDKYGVYAYNDIVATRRIWKHGLGSFGVVGKGFATLLGEWGDREIELSTVKENGALRLAIKAGKSLTKLPALPINQFVFEEPKMKGVLGKLTELSRLEETLDTVADSSANPVHKAVTLAVTQGERTIMAYSTAGPTMTHAKVGRLSIPSKEDRSWIIPKLAIQQMLAISKGEVSLYLGKQGVIAKVESNSVVSKLHEGPPPDFHSPLKKGKKVVTIKGWKLNKALEEALSTASLIYNESDAICFFEIEDGKISIQTKSSLGSEFKTSIPVGLEIGDNTFSFHANPNALLAAFQSDCLTKDSKLEVQDVAALFGNPLEFMYATAFSVVANQAREEDEIEEEQE